VVEIIIAGIILGITLAFMVGPVFLLLIETSLTKGVKKAIIFDLGVVLADILFIGGIAYGSSLLLSPKNVIWIYSIGGLLIVAYGFFNISSAKKKKLILAKELKLPEVNGSAGVYFAKGFFMNFLNMGVLAYWLTTTVTLQATISGQPNENHLLIAYFVSTVATYFVTDLFKIFTAQRIKKVLTPEVLIKIERIVGFVLIVFGALLIVRGYLSANGIGPEAGLM
jgi:threonine/homoserine/homoserine lactone efflux protein